MLLPNGKEKKLTKWEAVVFLRLGSGLRKTREQNGTRKKKCKRMASFLLNYFPLSM